MARQNRNTNKPTQERNLFVTDLEDIFFGSIVEELSTQIIQTFILYYQIDEERSEYDNIYGETTKLVFKNPIKIYCFVEEEEPTVQQDKGGLNQIKNINCYIHKRRLEELSVLVKEGDFVEWNGLSYLIVSAVDTRHISGVGRFRDTIKLSCILPDYNQELNK